MEDPQNENSETVPIKFPKQSIFIVIFELLFGFGACGITALLTVYFHQGLHMNESEALIIYHIYISIKLAFPLLGAIIADSYLGKYRTFFLAQLFYLSGMTLLFLSTLIDLGLSSITFTHFAMSLIMFGSGCGAPCINALGGDQFKMPEQEKQLSFYFQIVYLFMNVGCFFSLILFPILRSEKCYGKDNCYPLAFGTALFSLVSAFIIFALGGFYYVIKIPKENMIIVSAKCISHAIKQKCRSSERKNHWLEHASDKYDESLINDIKLALKLFIVLATLPIYYCLFNQQNSDWPLQAIKLDGDFGYFTVLPEQTQTLNPILIMILIPLFHAYIDPFLIKVNFCATPIKRTALGFFMTAAAFATSGWIYFCIYAELPNPPENGTVEIRAYNPEASPAEIHVKGIEDLSKISLDSFDNKEWLHVKFEESSKEVFFNDFKTNMNQGKSYAVYNFAEGVEVYEMMIEQPKTDSIPRITTIVASKPEVVFKSQGKGSDLKVDTKNLNRIKIDVGRYKLKQENEEIDKEIIFKAGGVYLIMANFEIKELKKIVLVKENSINMLWIIPQIVFMTIGEIFVSVTLLEFSYSHAPVSMKSILQAMRMLMSSIGNFLVVVVSLFKFPHRGYNAIIYSALLILNMLLLLFIEKKYKYKAVADRSSMS